MRVGRAVVLVALAALAPIPAGAQSRAVQIEQPAASGRRLALVIGNASYATGALSNPINDATDLAATLQALKFDYVKLATDTSKVALQGTIDAFVDVVKQGDAVVVYYSGHGIQLNGENYLLPIDFVARSEAEARYEAYSANLLHDRLGERGAQVRVMILDACRNNPFRSSRALSGGLAAMTWYGSYIAFATAPGDIADDNPGGRNGLFTTYLLDALRQPGLTLDQTFAEVKANVNAISNRRQRPWTSSDVVGEFYFHPPTLEADLPAGPVTPKPVDQIAPPSFNPRAAVLQVLDQYRAAYESMDVESLRRVYPSFENFQALQARFADLQSVAMAMGNRQVTIDPDSQRATATCLYSITFIPRTGRTESTPPVRAEFQLRRQGGAWVIERIAYK